MSGNAKKKFRSKWFRVAVEGQTTDGRTIERSWITDMAASYNRATYGARVWIEHFRSLLPDSPFRAYGDVLATKAEEVEIDGQKRLALFAQVDPTDDLVKIVNDQRQKIFSSIEVGKHPSTGKPYLFGLAVTDNPASLGTEILSFSAQHPDANPLAARKQAPDNLFSVATAAEIEFEEVDVAPGSLFEKLSARIDAVLGKLADSAPATPIAPPDDEAAPDLAEAFSAITDHLGDQDGRIEAAHAAATAAREAISKLSEQFNAFRQQMDATPDPSQPNRPAATGSAPADQTDC